MPRLTTSSELEEQIRSGLAVDISFPRTIPQGEIVTIAQFFSFSSLSPESKGQVISADLYLDQRMQFGKPNLSESYDSIAHVSSRTSWTNPRCTLTFHAKNSPSIIETASFSFVRPQGSANSSYGSLSFGLIGSANQDNSANYNSPKSMRIVRDILDVYFSKPLGVQHV